MKAIEVPICGSSVPVELMLVTAMREKREAAIGLLYTLTINKAALGVLELGCLMQAEPACG